MPSSANERKLRKSRIKSEFRTMLYLGESCFICKRKRAHLEYHHVHGGANKKDNVSRLINDGYSPQTILKEIEKCVPLCKQCHQYVHKHKVDMEKEYNISTIRK